MNKDKKISLLDYFIVVFVVIFFTIVSLYSYVIWPKEEKFKSVDRSRMERIADAEILYKDLTGDYTEDSFRLFALMEAVRDTLYGDSLFEGTRDIVLAKKIKRYVVNDNINNNYDTLFVDASAAFSFEFAEGVKLYSKFILDKLNLSSQMLDSLTQKQIIENIIEHNTTKNKVDDNSIYAVSVDGKYFEYSVKDYNNYINSNIYTVSPLDMDSSNYNSDYYKSVIDGKILSSEKDLKDVTIAIEVPSGFRYKLDTTFTQPIKKEQVYNDTIISIRVLSFNPTENFIDNLNGIYDEGEEFIDELNGIYDEGESFTDVIGNYIYDEGEEFIDGPNGRYDKGEDFTDLGNGVWDEGEKFVDVGNGVYDKGEKFTDLKNGIYDKPEKYKDKNKNNRWDEGEKYSDANENGRYDSGDIFFDKNDNGKYDKDKEQYVDIVGNGIWDEGEEFIDIGDGVYNEGEAFTDLGNGVWDENEDYIDDGKNGVYDKGEKFTDTIGNGVWDEGEEFVDALNGIWDDGEEFNDFGQDGCSDSSEDGKGGCLDKVNDKYKEGTDPNMDNYTAENEFGAEGNGKYDGPNTRYDKGEDFVDALNGVYDKGEEFTDKGNGRYDKGEEFIDGPNGRYDEGEDFVDGPNGYWDEGEEFVDALNGVWDEGEEFVDALNGVYDEGVDRYYHIQFIKTSSLLEYTGEPFTDCDSSGVCKENQDWNYDLDIVWDDAEKFEDINYNGKWDGPNGIWDEGEAFTDLGNGKYDRGEEFDDALNGVYDKPEPYTDLNGNKKWDKGEGFEDIDGSGSWSPGEAFTDCDNSGSGICEGDDGWKESMGNGVWDEGEKFEDDLNEIWDEGEKFEDTIGDGMYNEGEEFVDGEPFVDKNRNGRWDPAEFCNDLNGNKKCDKRNVMFIDQLPGSEVVERKTVYMDYITKIDTLSVDSLYSSINKFRHNYADKDLFLINVTRFENDLVKIDVEPRLGFDSQTISEGEDENLIDEEYKKNRFYYSVPFLAESIYSDLYYKEKEEKEIVVSSPVAKNENWRYWHEMNYSNENSFSLPTPFSFYTGDHGQIVNNEKSWVD